jgi:hypothetical protein
MDFKLSKVIQEIPAVKRIISDAPMPDWLPTKPLGGGFEGEVSGHGSVAIKQMRMRPGISTEQRVGDIIDGILVGEIGMQHGIHFAPFLDYVIKKMKDETHVYALMPFIDGTTLKHENGLDALLGIGTDGLKTFFRDYPLLHEIGFIAENGPMGDNYVITDKHINMIDLATNKKRTPHPLDKSTRSEIQSHQLNQAVLAILQHWHRKLQKSMLEQSDALPNGTLPPTAARKKFFEIAGGAESILSSMLKKSGNPSNALKTARAFFHTDFTDPDLGGKVDEFKGRR